jgi:hypothetical protein
MEYQVFRDKGFLAIRRSLNEIAGRGWFPALYLQSGWQYYAKTEDRYGWMALLFDAKEIWSDQIELRVNPKRKMAITVRVTGFLESPKGRR